jgi:hypothetical protein
MRDAMRHTMTFGARSLVALMFVATLSRWAAASDRCPEQDGPVPRQRAPDSSSFRRVVFVASARDASRGLEVALRAQTSDLPVDVVTLEDSTTRDLQGQTDFVLCKLRAHGADGAFWADVSADGEILLAYVEPDGSKVLVRRLSPASSSAGLDEVAIVTRSTIQALLAGKTIGMQAASAEHDPSVQILVVPPIQPATIHAIPATQTPVPEIPRESPLVARDLPPLQSERAAQPMEPVRAPTPQHVARVAVGYVGSSFSPELAWTHGAAVTARWLPRKHVSLGAGGSLFPAREVAAGPTRLRLTRGAAEVFVGFEGAAGDFRYGLDLVGLVDYTTRSTVDTTGSLEPTDGAGHVSPGFSPRGRLAFSPWPSTAFEVGGGLDILIDPPHYGTEGSGRSSRIPVLTSDALRPRMEAGLAQSF